MAIRATLQLRRLSLRMHAPLSTAHGPMSAREGVALRLVGDDGIVGQGEAMPLEDFGTESLAQTLSALESLGSSGIELPALPGALEPLLQPLEGRPAARGALELAALELQARRAGRPLAQWLFEHARATSPEVVHRLGITAPARSIPVNALLSAQDPSALCAQGLRAIAQGARTLKVKVAAGAPGLDVERLRALREAVGPAVRLRLDANAGWSRELASLSLAYLAEACAPELCEQPVAAADVEGLASLRSEGHCLIGADEAMGDPARAEQVIVSGAADAVVLKPMVLGGVLPALRLGLLARARGLRVIVTSAMDGVIARAGAAHLAAVIGEPEWAHGLWVGPLFVDEPPHPYVPREGRIEIPDRVGLGLEPPSEDG